MSAQDKPRWVRPQARENSTLRDALQEVRKAVGALKEHAAALRKAAAQEASDG